MQSCQNQQDQLPRFLKVVQELPCGRANRKNIIPSRTSRTDDEQISEFSELQKIAASNSVSYFMQAGESLF